MDNKVRNLQAYIIAHVKSLNIRLFIKALLVSFPSPNHIIKPTDLYTDLPHI